MATKFYGAIDLIGGGIGALDAIDGTGLNNGDGAFVLDYQNSNLYFYWLNATSGAGESSPNIISPNTNAGTKRWILTTLQSAQWAGMRQFLDSSDMATALNGIGLDVEHAWIPAAGMEPNITNGCAPIATHEYATNDVMHSYLAFSWSTEEYACFSLRMPTSWDRLTVKFKAYWAPDYNASTATAAETVEWQLQAVSAGHDENLDQAFTDTGEIIVSTVTAGVEDDLHISGVSPAITINNTPAVDDLVTFKLSRNVAGTDDMVGDAWLFGIGLEISHAYAVSAWS